MIYNHKHIILIYGTVTQLGCVPVFGLWPLFPLSNGATHPEGLGCSADAAVEHRAHAEAGSRGHITCSALANQMEVW